MMGGKEKNEMKETLLFLTTVFVLFSFPFFLPIVPEKIAIEDTFISFSQE